MQSAMTRTKRPLRLSRWVVLGVFLIALPACQSPDGRLGGWFQRPPADSTNLAYRPIFSWLEQKRPLYLSNYAGDDFGPMRPRRNPAGVPVIVPPEAPPQVTIQQGTWDSE